MRAGALASHAGVDGALARLNALLPLTKRQRALDPELRRLHRAILAAFAKTGRPPAASDFSAGVTAHAGMQALGELAARDLIVRAADRRLIGAYPFTLEATCHRITAPNFQVHAMCAVDALAVGPVFGLTTRVDSVCAQTQVPVRVIQERGRAATAEAEDEVRVGIRWRPPGECAAHSLCREMVFLVGPAAEVWQAAGSEATVLELEAAVRLGFEFFAPLVEGE